MLRSTLLIVSTIVLAGCAASPGSRAPRTRMGSLEARSVQPEWVRRGTGQGKGPGSQRLLQGVGRSAGVRNRALAIFAADAAAKTELARLLADAPDQAGAKKAVAAAKASEHWRDPRDGAMYALVEIDVDAAGLGGSVEWAAEPQEDLEAFRARAAELRSKAAQPVTEDSRRYRVQAESAVTEKRFEDAARRYRQAIDASPWWADGYFNLALVLGELGRAREAIIAMKKYLFLAPDAPDARDAQDKIYVWEDKAGL